jgi:hypothetical protein
VTLEHVIYFIIQLASLLQHTQHTKWSKKLTCKVQFTDLNSGSRIKTLFLTRLIHSVFSVSKVIYWNGESADICTFPLFVNYFYGNYILLLLLLLTFHYRMWSFAWKTKHCVDAFTFHVSRTPVTARAPKLVVHLWHGHNACPAGTGAEREHPVGKTWCHLAPFHGRLSLQERATLL